jgi:DNA-binding GntR family transcriptional regulator
MTDTLPYYDPTNLNTCRAFVDAKKKLRIVLASADTDSIHNLNSSMHFGQYLSQQANHQSSIDRRSSNYLLTFLRWQLYEAIALQDRDLQAQLHETLRSIQQFAEHECRQLVRSMIDDYRSRSIYITYLLKNTENLLNVNYHQDRLLVRIQR